MGKPIHFVATTAFAVVLAVTAPRFAISQSADLAQVMNAMKALESRVAALESENRNVRKEASDARNEARALRQQLASAPAAPVSVLRRESAPPLETRDARSVPVASLAPSASWAGLYAGASFGLGGLHGSSRYDARSRFSDTFTGADFVDSFTETDRSLDSATNKHGVIALADLYVGYNFAVGSNFVVGLQGEGTLSRGSVKLTGTGASQGSSVSTETDLSVTPPSTFTSTTTTRDAYTVTDAMSMDWMISVLARGGWADQLNYVYGIGGWSYAQFSLYNAFGYGLGLHGPTVGIGWERKLMPGWSLKAEYRYTHFLPGTFSDAFSGASASTSGSGSSSSAGSTDTTISAHLHAVRLGITHYFGTF